MRQPEGQCHLVFHDTNILKHLCLGDLLPAECQMARQWPFKATWPAESRLRPRLAAHKIKDFRSLFENYMTLA
jgi:hypothetical protein